MAYRSCLLNVNLEIEVTAQPTRSVASAASSGVSILHSACP